VTQPPWETDGKKPAPPAPGPNELAQTTKLAQLGLMAGALIHELRQPLMGIKGYTQVLIEGAAGETKARAELILQQIGRLEELIERYRRYVRTEPPQVGVMSFADGIREALQIVDPRLRAAGAEVSVSIPDGLPGIRCGEGQVTQVAVNLLGNACDAIAQSKNRRVSVLVLREGAWLSLYVADYGPGIPPEIAGKIFAPLFTTKPAETGTGLGLYVSRAIAEAQGGSVELVSPDSVDIRPPPSTVFRLRLPVAEAGSASKPSVLVVDDEEIVRTLMRDLLVPDGLDVTLAASGTEGAKLIQSGRFDVVITDKNLPDVNGMELARLARTRYPECAVILMTAYPSLESAQAALDLGLLDYLEKPFPDIAEVRRKVREVLRESRDRVSAVAAPAPPPQSRRVLIVDDNDTSAAALLEAVSIAGAVAVRATSLAGAAKVAAESPLAGVILSLDLKDRALGPKAIRDLKGPSNVPLIALCDQPSFEGTIAAIRMGAAACLPRALASARALANELPRFFKLPR
jgi:DNA-binding response OmpR family regulator